MIASRHQDQHVNPDVCAARQGLCWMITRRACNGHYGDHHPGQPNRRPASQFGSDTGSVLLPLFAVLDVAIIVVIVREYRLLRRERRGVNPAR